MKILPVKQYKSDLIWRPPDSLSFIERECVRQALLYCQGNLTRTGRELRIGKTTVYRKVRKYFPKLLTSKINKKRDLTCLKF